jgi:hypothetical protein
MLTRSQLPDGGYLLLLGAFGIRRFRMLIRVLGMLLGLGGVLFALGMVILAMSLGRGAMGLCSGLMKFRGLVVFVFHVVFSCWPANCGYRTGDLNSGRTECQSCFNRERAAYSAI